MQADIWVLADHRAGTAIQAKSLAEVLGMSFEVKNLKYNSLAILPNFLLRATSIHVNTKLSSPLYDEPLPKIIISAGRRTAPVALALKAIDPSIKVVQIMRPDLDPRKFDLIILPQHDTFGSSPNILRVIGALHNVEGKIKAAKEEFAQNHPTIGNFIAVLVGGNGKKYKFSEQDAAELIQATKKVSTNHGLQVFISFSRRTPEAVKALMRQAFPWPHVIYDPAVNTDPNPYFGLLASASFIITTCDSISMCSEATASGKPLYIYCPDKADLPKHKYFLQQLFDLQIARKLTKDIEVLESYTYEPFNETSKAADFIRANIMRA
jgi:mitochondrial fission protein ELM1